MRRRVGPLLLVPHTGPSVGAGHVMRCLALAQEWTRQGGQAVFGLAHIDSPLPNRIRAEGFQIAAFNLPMGETGAPNELAALASRIRASWVALDGYPFGFEYQSAIRASEIRLLCIDDGGMQRAALGDIIVDQNLDASKEDYASRKKGSKLLLGPQFLLLRREFRDHARPLRASATRAKRVLVTMGAGSNPVPFRKVMEALCLLSSGECEALVLAAGDPKIAEIVAETTRKASIAIRVEREFANTWQVMQWAEVAVSGAGTTTWELAFLGIPTLLVSIAENQVGLARALAKNGLVHYLGHYDQISGPQVAQELVRLLNDQNLRGQMSSRAMEVIDERGAERVVNAMRARMISLRHAKPGDAKLVWQWANDRETRSASFESDSIPWPDHEKWYASKLSARNSPFYIATDPMKSTPVGLARFELQGDTAIISVNVAPDFRRKGFGVELIRVATRQFAETAPIYRIEAYVKPENERSIHAFTQAGYTKEGTTEVKGKPAIRMAVSKEELFG